MTKELKKRSPLHIFLSYFKPHIGLFALEIDEQGGHGELLERNGAYANLWHTQNGRSDG